MTTTITTLRAMFYMLTLSETFYVRIEDVPDFIVTVSPLTGKRMDVSG